MSSTSFLWLLFVTFLISTFAAIEVIDPEESDAEVIDNPEEEVTISDDDLNQKTKNRFSYTPTWTLTDDKFTKVLSADVGERFESNEFKLSNSSWQLFSYPNGHDASSEGSYMIFLYLLEKADEWKEITLSLGIFCPLTGSAFTRIVTYDSPKGKGWYPNNLLLQELTELAENDGTSEMKWVVDVRILRVTGTDDTIIFESNINYRSNKHGFQWTVQANTSLLNQMQNAYFGKSFQYQLVDMWGFRVYPSGNMNEGSVETYISLLALPPGVSSVIAQYSITCVETNTTSTVTKEFSYRSSYWSWPQDLLTFDEFKEQDTITFVVDIEIINLFDKDRYDIVTAPYISDLKKQIKNIEFEIANRINELDNIKDSSCDVKDVDEIKQKYDELSSIIQTMKENQDKANDKFAKDISLLKNQINTLTKA